MVWFLLLHLVMFLVDLVTVTRRTDRDKDLEILLLRHQLRLVQRDRPRPPRLSRWEKLTLAVLTAKLTHLTAGPRARLDQVLLLFKPDTVLKWHRVLVCRKWTIRHRITGGRPAVPAAVEALVLRFAHKNPAWGYRRILGELAKLGHRLSHTTVRAILQRHGLPPAPERRRRGSTWRVFLSRHCDQMLACDFFTVETLFLNKPRHMIPDTYWHLGWQTLAHASTEEVSVDGRKIDLGRHCRFHFSATGATEMCRGS